MTPTGEENDTNVARWEYHLMTRQCSEVDSKFQFTIHTVKPAGSFATTKDSVRLNSTVINTEAIICHWWCLSLPGRFNNAMLQLEQ